MNLRLLASLLVAAVLCGCATHSTKRPNAVERNGIVPAQERPGLGTAWGEQRESWAEPAPFARASGERPAGRDRLYYNDREGVNAMLDFLGGKSNRCDGLQPSAGGLVRMGLRIGNDRWTESHELKDHRLAVSERGDRYEIVLKNDGRRAVEVVLSVDGLDVIDGKAASVKKRGYVMAPFETLAVDGFRTSDTTVAAFRFGSVFDSYGRRRHGSAINAGVIGIAVFEEKRQRTPTAPQISEPHAWRHVGTRPTPSGQQYATPPDA